jgi:hypothetical protein
MAACGSSMSRAGTGVLYGPWHSHSDSRSDGWPRRLTPEHGAREQPVRCPHILLLEGESLVWREIASAWLS